MGYNHIGVITLCVLVSGCLAVTPQNFYTAELVEKFGANSSLTISQLEDLLKALKAAATESHEKAKHPTNGHHGDCTKASWVDNKHCRKTKCLSSKRVYELYNISETTPLDGTTLNTLCPALLYQVQNEGECQNYTETSEGNGDGDKIAKSDNDSARVWGFGFLFVTLVNLCSLGGIIVLPFMSKVFYRWLLMFLIALAVGTLAGSASFFLIPDAFEMPEHDPEGKYIWKACVVCVGIYLFFLIERILKMIMDYRMAKNDQQEIPAVEVDLTHLPTASIKTHREVSVDDSMKIPPDTKAHIHHGYGGAQHSASSTQLVDRSSPDCNGITGVYRGMPEHDNNGGNEEATDRLLEDPELAIANGNKKTNATTTTTEVKKTAKDIAPVAWMIIIGDALHNFVDGLSIGAGFTVSTLAGISVSLAVICEEFPHELGDFAILINSGMTKWQALGFNFLSALSCYVGLIIGIAVGENFNASTWIFALAGGMFLYISLVDMMNDVNHATEEEDFKDCKLKLFIVQNLGLLVGFVSMLLLALYSGDITLE